MPAILDAMRSDLAYGWDCEMTPCEPNISGTAQQVLDWVDKHVDCRQGPVFERVWVREIPVVSPRVGLILWSLELGQKVEVALATDDVPFTQVYLCPEASAVLGCSWPGPPGEVSWLQAKSILRLAGVFLSASFKDFLCANPNGWVGFIRPTARYGVGWWRVCIR